MSAVASEITSTERYRDSTVIYFKIKVDSVTVKMSELGPEGTPVEVDKIFSLQVQDGLNLQDCLTAYLTKFKAALTTVEPPAVTDVAV